jgi:fermentation-respiration switch protein FrsA (DUF1100 family)
MLAITLIAIQLVVWLLEPRLAFFPTRGVQHTPKEFGLAFTDVRVPTPDGETLHGWWLAHPEPRGQVVFWHGNGGNLSLWLDVIAELRHRGFSVLAVDYRGYGASTGSPSERGIYVDADAAVAHFQANLRKPGSPVIFWGRSIGTPVAASTTQNVRPDALVLESPFSDIAAVLRGNPVMRLLSLFSSYRFATLRLMERYDGPLLVVHGDADTIIPFRAGRDLFDRAPTARKEFAVIKGADHNDLHVVDPAGYWAAIDRFVAGLPKP